MAGRSVEAFPELEKIMTFDIIYNAGGKSVSSMGVGLILEDGSPASRSSATRGCAPCAYRADLYREGGRGGTLLAACSGFGEGDIIAVLGIVPKRGKPFPTRVGSEHLTESYTPPCGVDLPGIVRNVLTKHTKGK